MGIAKSAPRGGLAESLAAAIRVLILRNGEIERFEDAHRGVFELWDGFFGRGAKPTAREVRDLLALGLVGGGMDDGAADALIAGLGPEENLQLYGLAKALLGVAFLPAVADDDSAPDGATSKKKTRPRAKPAPRPGGSAP